MLRRASTVMWLPLLALSCVGCAGGEAGRVTVIERAEAKPAERWEWDAPIELERFMIRHEGPPTELTVWWEADTGGETRTVAGVTVPLDKQGPGTYYVAAAHSLAPGLGADAALNVSVQIGDTHQRDQLLFDKPVRLGMVTTHLGSIDAEVPHTLSKHLLFFAPDGAAQQQPIEEFLAQRTGESHGADVVLQLRVRLHASGVETK
jgi:hypothetical protein